MKDKYFREISKKKKKEEGRKKFLKFSNENIKNSVTKIDPGTKK